MNSLKKSIMGKYDADDVDELLKKVRSDYESCLHEQKERIVALREDNRQKSLIIETYKENEKYIVNAITKAEETAQSIIEEAEERANKRLYGSKLELKQIDDAVQTSYQRLYRLTRASEAVFRSVTMMLDNFESEDRQPQTVNIKPVKKLF